MLVRLWKLARMLSCQERLLVGMMMRKTGAKVPMLLVLCLKLELEEFLQVKEADVLCGLFKALIMKNFLKLKKQRFFLVSGILGGLLA